MRSGGMPDRQHKRIVFAVTGGNVDLLACRRWKLVAEGAQGAVGGAWRQDAKKWLNRGRAGRSRGVLAEPVALQPLETAQRRHSQRQGSESTQHHKVH